MQVQVLSTILICASERRGVAFVNDDIAIGSTPVCIATAQACSRCPCTGALRTHLRRAHSYPPLSGRAGAGGLSVFVNFVGVGAGVHALVLAGRSLSLAGVGEV